jgi:ABC-type phosphate transport system auxiliary subunit
VPEGYAGAIGEAALLGSPFDKATFLVPPDPGVVRELSKPESSRERKAREKVEREVEAERKAAEKHAAAKARGIARNTAGLAPILHGWDTLRCNHTSHVADAGGKLDTDGWSSRNSAAYPADMNLAQPLARYQFQRWQG